MSRARPEDRRFYDLVPAFDAMAATRAVTEGRGQTYGRRRTPSKDTAFAIRGMSHMHA